MNDLIPVLNQFRLWASQLLQLCFTYWVTMLPFAFMAVDEVGKLLKRIKQ